MNGHFGRNQHKFNAFMRIGMSRDQHIINVKQILGHKNINNTMIYINLERAIFKESNDEFTVRDVDTLEEARKLLEVGFEYVCDMNGKKLFRKRK